MRNLASESMESMRKFGPAGRLYPYVGMEVRTPRGNGILLSVIGGMAQVQLYRTREKEHGIGSRTVRFRPVTSFPAAEVRPANEARRRSA